MKLRSPDRTALRGLAAATRKPSDMRRSLGVETATRRWLIGGVLPLWLGAGLADWYRHKQTHIETTAGPRESMIHALMMTEAGVPVALGLFCEVNAGVLATCAGALGVHSATAYWDVSYAEQRRRVTPVEQHIHSLLEVVPLMATGFLATLYWDQARTLVGGDGKPDFRVRLKRRDPLSGKTRLALLGAMGLFGALPYAEEMIRCLRARPTLKAQPPADVPPTPTLAIPADPVTTRTGA
ncbi:diguanylate cyclase [Actinomadura rubrisoli]|uniref:diguanylate cyclase n=1 Tax=Actinomadura rubrisoli TaxID=2530368 RepID=UPI001A9E82CF|nr:diguanylate cyclase [Actinomadura rubrisoli]